MLIFDQASSGPTTKTFWTDFLSYRFRARRLKATDISRKTIGFHCPMLSPFQALSGRKNLAGSSRWGPGFPPQ